VTVPTSEEYAVSLGLTKIEATVASLLAGLSIASVLGGLPLSFGTILTTQKALEHQAARRR
jgi:hypothetical protein